MGVYRGIQLLHLGLHETVLKSQLKRHLWQNSQQFLDFIEGCGMELQGKIPSFTYQRYPQTAAKFFLSITQINEFGSNKMNVDKCL